ncbi:hypothetical protein RFI_04234 [Reticulomyxa filosa]|uniref:Uncharacterized protein n=1 Tax=Reticulomyxa filosa TaxID=46433 RepID=X6P2Y0_RETFI|nr:hypothetical protein RFI_04234 [Reticulomyxa filosa]|eukprot:ETO32885.1 hypothetical protein RFI_04234 [Reticulomyxa filosa]
MSTLEAENCKKTRGLNINKYISVFAACVNGNTRFGNVGMEMEKMYGGMENTLEYAIQSDGREKFAKEIKALLRLCNEITNEEELRKMLEQNDGNIEKVVELMVSKLLKQKVRLVHTCVYCYILLLVVFFFFFFVNNKE